MTSESSPYVGPRPFEVEDQTRFFGRDREAQDLLSMVVAHRVALLYAQSGAGKTSLVNARLIPMLRDEEFEVFPVARLRAVVPEGVRFEAADNPFTLSVMLHWASELGEAPASLSQLTLRDYLAAHPHRTDDLDEPLPRLLIFDQFEELFTAHVEHWEKREAFVQQVADALAADPMLRALVAIREDFVAQLDPFAPLLPGQLQARYRIERLRAPASVSAIVGPLAETGRRYEHGVPEMLVQELLRNRVENAEGEIVDVVGQYVEPVQLQVVCQSIWANLPPEVTVITEQHLREFGNVDKALNDFYDRVVEEAVRQTGVKRDRLREWCERVLITGLGTRNTVYRGPHDTGGMENAVIDALEDLRLIRAERRAGARWYELTHDRLIEPIRASNREWYQSTDEGRARRLLDRDKADPGNVLTSDELRTVEPHLPNLTIDPQTQALLDRSRAEIERLRQEEKQRRQRERRFRLAVIAGIIAAMAVAGSLFTVALVQQIAAKAAAEQSRIAALATGEAEAAATNIARINATATAEVALVQVNAERQATIDQSLRLASSAQQALAANDPDLALALAIEANRIPDPPGLAQSILSQIAYAPGTRLNVVFDTPVYSVAFGPPRSADQPESQTAFVGLGNGAVVWWDTSTGEEIRRFEGHAKAVNSVAVSPDGRYIVSGSRDSGDSSLILWDVDGEVRRFAAPNWVTSVAFSPDSRTVLSGAADGSVRLWDVATGAELRNLQGHTAQVVSVAFSHDGTRALSGAYDNTAILWDIETGAAVYTLSGHSGWVNSVVFSPDDRFALTGSRDGTMRLWDVAAGVVLRRYASDTAINSVAFSPDGQSLVSGMADGTVRVWDANSEAEIRRLYGHTKPVRAVVYDPGGRYALSGSEDNSARIWDLNYGAEIRRYTGHTSQVWGVALSPDGARALSGGQDRSAIVWDIATGQILHRLLGHDASVTSVAFSPDGRYAVSGGQDNRLILWDVESGEEVRRMEGHTDWVISVDYGARYIVSGSRDQSVILWDAATGELLRRLEGRQSTVVSVAVDDWGGETLHNPEGRPYVFTGYDDGAILMWDAETGEIVRSFEGHTDTVASIKSYGDNGLLSASFDQTMVRWNTTTGEELTRFAGHTAPVRSAVLGYWFDEDAGVVASGSFDTSVRLWKVLTGEEIRRYLGHNDRVYGVALGPASDPETGLFVLSGSADGTLRLWRVDTLDEMIDWTYANRYVRELTCAERDQYRVLPPCDPKTYTQD